MAAAPGGPVKEENEDASFYRLSATVRRSLAGILRDSDPPPYVDLTEDDEVVEEIIENQVDPEVPSMKFPTPTAKKSLPGSSDDGCQRMLAKQAEKSSSLDNFEVDTPLAIDESTSSSTNTDEDTHSAAVDTDVLDNEPILKRLQKLGKRTRRTQSRDVPSAPDSTPQESMAPAVLFAVPFSKGWRRYYSKVRVYYTTPKRSADSVPKKIYSVSQLLQYLSAKGETELSMANFSFKPTMIGLGSQFETEFDEPEETSTSSDTAELSVSSPATGDNINVDKGQVSAATTSFEAPPSKRQKSDSVPSETTAHLKVFHCSSTRPACLSACGGKMEPSVPCKLCHRFYHQDCTKDKGTFKKSFTETVFICANCADGAESAMALTDSAGTGKTSGEIAPCTQSCPVPYVLKRPTLPCSGCDGLYHRQCAPEKGFVRGGKFICFACVPKEDVNPKELNQNFNLIKDFDHRLPQVQMSVRPTAPITPAQLNQAVSTAGPPVTSNSLNHSVGQIFSALRQIRPQQQSPVRQVLATSQQRPVGPVPLMSVRPPLPVFRDQRTNQFLTLRPRTPFAPSSDTLSLAQQRLAQQRVMPQPYVSSVGQPSFAPTIVPQHCVLPPQVRPSQPASSADSPVVAVLAALSAVCHTEEPPTPLFASPTTVTTTVASPQPAAVMSVPSTTVSVVTEAHSTTATSSVCSSPATVPPQLSSSPCESSSVVTTTNTTSASITRSSSAASTRNITSSLGECASPSVSSTAATSHPQDIRSRVSRSLPETLRLVYAYSRCLQQIFQYLPAMDLIRVSQVNRSWNVAAKDSRLWRIVRIKENKLNVTNWSLAADFMRRRGTIYLYLHNIGDQLKSFCNHLNEFCFLERLVVGPLDPQMVIPIGAAGQMLRFLNLSFDTFDTAEPMSLAPFENMQKLDTLSISLASTETEKTIEIKNYDFLTKFQKLKQLYLLDLTCSDPTGLSVLSVLPHLAVLHIDRMKWDNERELPFVSLKMLRELHLEGPCAVSNRRLAIDLPKMHSIVKLELVKFVFTKDLMDALCELKILEYLSLWPDLSRDESFASWSTCLSGVRKIKTLQTLDFGIQSTSVTINQTLEDSSFPFVSLSIEDPTKFDTIRIRRLHKFLSVELAKTKIRILYSKFDMAKKTRVTMAPCGTSGGDVSQADNEVINPPADKVRLDGKDHWCSYGDQLRKCLQCAQATVPNWTFVSCTKCSVPLCFNKGRNCFVKFHQHP